MFPVVGIIVLILLVFGGFALTGGNLGPVMHALPHEMLIIGGAALGSLIIGNSGADIAAISFRRMIERHGENAGLRGALLRHPRLPSDCRHMLVVRVGDVLKRSTLLQRSIGATRAERVTRDACVRASLV